MPELPAGSFAKEDGGSDLAFYAPARLVTHIDASAIAALVDHYRRTLPDRGRVLDVGHGMNSQELAANPRLDDWFVQDLNREPTLPLADHRFDAALCCVGAQYLQRPVAVFAEVRRTLAPEAPFIASFSNRCFPTKAVAIWRALDTNGHAALVKLYLERAGFSAVTVDLLADGTASDPLVAVTGRA